MNRLRGLATLMIITILGITAFQLYWLKQNYDREKKNLAIKSDITFRETIRQLQGKKLKWESLLPDSLKDGKVRVFVNTEDHGPMKIPMGPKAEIVSTINILKEKLRDSLTNKKVSGTGILVSGSEKAALDLRMDTTGRNTGSLPVPKKDIFFKMLYGVDSLQDSLRLKEIDSAYAVAMKKMNIPVPFTVSRLDSFVTDDEPGSNRVTVGFAHPITYHFDLGNTFPYLIKRISTPILFSVFLLGFTILSFVLLYRSLLRQRKLALLKNEFISNITHELKTPIATVGVAIEALRNFNAIQNPEKTKEYLDISSNELQRLSLLVDKVLKLSMFEKKEIELKYEMMNMKEVVDEVVSSMRLQIEKYHARVSVTSEGDLNLTGDRLHLLSVVFNLLDNALKYSKGDPSIQIDLKGAENNVQITVTDNGIGIPAEYKDKVFDKFFRVPTGDTHNAKGYGLGLSYVSHVIQKHKGTIWVDSQPGTGSKFVITLPRQQS
jgi:two-component system phosphate regulon sensor histidine kinase PhoR